MTASSLWVNLKKQWCRTCHLLFCSRCRTFININYEYEQMSQCELVAKHLLHGGFLDIYFFSRRPTNTRCLRFLTSHSERSVVPYLCWIHVEVFWHQGNFLKNIILILICVFTWYCLCMIYTVLTDASTLCPLSQSRGCMSNCKVTVRNVCMVM